MEKDKEIIRLIQKYRAGTATEAEVRYILECIHADEYTDLIDTTISKGLLESVSDTKQSPYLNTKFDRLYKEINRRRKRTSDSSHFHKRNFTWLWYASAATIILVAGIFLYTTDQHSSTTTGNAQAEVILPGGDRATLTLADGSTLVLDSTQSGIVISNGDIKYKDGNLIRDAQANALGSIREDVLLELSTPKGGNYHVILPDGTKVWLNAASSLKYPARFSGNTRTVELSGEGFFEIEPDKKRPFKVLSGGQEVVALGTSFNVLAYPDEKSAKTTLVSGLVEINTVNQLTKELISTKRLAPSQQAVVEGGKLTVNTVEIGAEVAWRHGLITFTDKSFSAIMREIERWYNIEVSYENAVPNVALYGGINRGDNFNTVLKLLQVSEVPCRLEGRKLIIE